MREWNISEIKVFFPHFFTIILADATTLEAPNISVLLEAYTLRHEVISSTQISENIQKKLLQSLHNVPSLKLTARTRKWMVGNTSFLFGMAYFQVLMLVLGRAHMLRCINGKTTKKKEKCIPSHHHASDLRASQPHQRKNCEVFLNFR